MPFTQEQTKKINDNFNKSKKTCPMCGGEGFVVHPEIIWANEFINGKTNPNGGVGFVAYSCTNCFHSILFNVIPMGLL